MSKRTLHTNLVGRTVRFVTEGHLLDLVDVTAEERAEVVAAHLVDGEIELLLQREDGTLFRAWPPWVAVVERAEP